MDTTVLQCLFRFLQILQLHILKEKARTHRHLLQHLSGQPGVFPIILIGERIILLQISHGKPLLLCNKLLFFFGKQNGLIQSAVIIFHHQFVFQLRTMHFHIRHALVKLPHQIIISLIRYVIERHGGKSAHNALSLPDFREGMHHGVNLPCVKSGLQRSRVLILPHPGTGDAMIRHIFIEFIFSYITAHNSKSSTAHGSKIFVGQGAVTVDGNGPKGIAAGQAGILVHLRPLFGILRRSHQVDFLIPQHLQSVVPVFAYHIFYFPVHIVAQCFQILHIHACETAVSPNLMITLHGKEPHPHGALLRAIYHPRPSS